MPRIYYDLALVTYSEFARSTLTFNIAFTVPYFQVGFLNFYIVDSRNPALVAILSMVVAPTVV